MRVALVGQPGWIELLAALLNEHGAGAVAAEAYHGRKALRLLGRKRESDVLLRVGYRPGAPTPRGVAFDTWWSLVERAHPGIPTVYYWIGTDLFNARADAAAGRLRRPFERAAAQAKHVAAAPWFVADLRELGVDASLVPFPTPLPDIAEPYPLPDTFSVLTYLPMGRSDHYGGDTVIRAARAMPDVPFVVVGREGRPIPEAPGNVESMPRQPTLDPCYRASTVVVRLVRHDAVGATVKEALVHARQVIYSYPLPFVERVAHDDAPALLDRLVKLRAKHESGRLQLNTQGRDYALAEFDTALLLQRLLRELENASS